MIKYTHLRTQLADNFREFEFRLLYLLEAGMQGPPLLLEGVLAFLHCGALLL